MLFPDFSRQLYRGTSWTATEDCFIVGSNFVPLSDDTPARLTIDGVHIDIDAGDNSHFAFCVAKGSVIVFGANFIAYGLKKGGRLESALIILSCTKTNQRRRPYAIK